jgi:hypothetical protein
LRLQWALTKSKDETWVVRTFRGFLSSSLFDSVSPVLLIGPQMNETNAQIEFCPAVIKLQPIDMKTEKKLES